MMPTNIIISELSCEPLKKMLHKVYEEARFFVSTKLKAACASKQILVLIEPLVPPNNAILLV